MWKVKKNVPYYAVIYFSSASQCVSCCWEFVLTEYKIFIQAKNATIKEVFNEIENNSEFIIMYSDDIIDVSEQVSVRVEDKTVNEVLTQIFRDSDYDYFIKDRQIVITQKEKENLKLMVQQAKIVSGLVTDQDGNPLPGVTIIVKGTTVGVISDFDGNYSLEIPDGAEALVFSFVGMSTKEITYTGQATINVSLQEETIGIGEIVAIGYGVQRKSDLTGATSRLTAENMNKSVATSPVEMMQGRISGVNIIQNNGEPGAGMSVRIRGSNSIRSGQEPLYVIDGIPLDNADITPNGGTAAGINEAGNKNPISFLNPEDIESIDILKDASSTAIYGARGANGVVIITTKKGKKGEGTISYDGYMGVSSIREKMDILSASEFRSYKKADGSKLLDKGASIDWQDEVFRTGITQSHNLSYEWWNRKLYIPCFFRLSRSGRYCRINRN